jgi:PIN like domain
MAVRRGHVRYFADENALGFARVLLQSRDDIVHPGHPLLPELPRGTPDLEWLRVVGHLDLIVVTRERRIRTRPAELEAYRRFGVRSVRIGGKRDMRPTELAELFTRLEPRLIRLATKLGPGPWAVAMRASGVRELPLSAPGSR